MTSFNENPIPEPVVTSSGEYVPPLIRDLGGFVELTQVGGLFFGHVHNLHDLSLSGTVGGGGGGGGVTPAVVGGHVPAAGGGTHTLPTVHHTTVTSGTAHPVSHGSSSPPASPGGTVEDVSTTPAVTTAAGATSTLPFTGYPLVWIAAIGTGASAAGAALRRMLSRRSS